ncbi:MAG TPA: hypothetical protein VF649_05965 [Sphingomonas sp.]|jgi:hypothetical protein|uniref:hypothetical protein n=1 Tax=Sphingomonas sp. TaxID=28214 RepID=UPI002ED8273D
MILDPDVIAAKARAAAARSRLEGTFTELQSRLNPASLAHTAWSGAVDRGADAWESAIDRGTEAWSVAVDRGTQATEEAVAFIRQRPGLTAAVATAALALIATPSLVRRARGTPSSPPDRQDPPRLTGPIPHLETRS